MSIGMYLAAITLAGNISGGQSVTLGPSQPTSITQLCSGGCVQVDVGNVKLFPNGCMEFVPSLQAPGPFTCTNVCATLPTLEDFCILNGTHAK